MPIHRVAMLMQHRGERDEEAREALASALPETTVGKSDELGIFEITLEAGDQEAALNAVWDAVAAAGVDDHIVFLEHPNLPEHWRHRAARPGG